MCGIDGRSGGPMRKCTPPPPNSAPPRSPPAEENEDDEDDGDGTRKGSVGTGGSGSTGTGGSGSAGIGGSVSLALSCGFLTGAGADCELRRTWPRPPGV